MGLILDTSLLIAGERGRFDLPGFLHGFPGVQPVIAAITASELLHGVERAVDPVRASRRREHVEMILASVTVLPFDLAQARVHSRIWANLASQGRMIGAHDLQIAAAGLALGFAVGTLNARDFERVAGLEVVDASPYLAR